MRTYAVAGVLVLVLGRGTSSQDPARRLPLPAGEVPIGLAGQPIGSYLTIEGAPEHSKFYNFRAEVVNGKKLKEALLIDVSNVPLKEGRRHILKGYESIKMVGEAPAVHEARREDGKPAITLPIPWQVHYYFVATSVVMPQGVAVIKVNAAQP